MKERNGEEETKSKKEEKKKKMVNWVEVTIQFPCKLGYLPIKRGCLFHAA